MSEEQKMGVEIGDLTGLSKPLQKLVEVVSNGIGVLYKPRSIRKEADAKAYEVEAIATANAKATLIEGEAKIELLERAKRRLVYQEIIRQENIESIADKSIKYLREEVSDVAVNGDWRIRFFNKAQHVSDQEMQEVWAEVLAGEISTPGSFGNRTLEVLSNLSVREANLFNLAAAISSGDSKIWKLGSNTAFEEFGLNFGSLLELRDAGLIMAGDNLVSSYSGVEAQVFLGEDIYLLRHPSGNSHKFKFKNYAFSRAGKELCRIVKDKYNHTYMEEIVSLWQKDGYVMNKLA